MRVLYNEMWVMIRLMGGEEIRNIFSSPFFLPVGDEQDVPGRHYYDILSFA